MKALLLNTFVQSIIAEMLILCVVIGVSTILVLFVIDSTDLLRKVLRRRK